MAALIDLLEQFRLRAKSEFEKGHYFERVAKLFLEKDDIQRQYYDEVWHFSEWAKAQGWHDTSDIGIDLVAKRSDGEGYAAIQCKFYGSQHQISKPDIDSFISAASNDAFTRLIIIDTTSKEFGKNALNVLNKHSKAWHRIGIAELDNSRIDWAAYIRDQSVVLRDKKSLRDHQRQALSAVEAGFADADRGKLVMACGTGKTFTGLRIAETLAGPGKTVLYMVPSLSLMSQSVREWKNDAEEPFTAFSACSDVNIGRRKGSADVIEFEVHDLAFPATTNALMLGEQVKHRDQSQMTVVFSTYHSIGVIEKAQQSYGLPEFDLIICDEAHRTTGVTLADEDDSNFVRIHDNGAVKGKKRLYMTATPRVFGDKAKAKASEYDAELASMDDESKFGKTLFHRGFGWAVENELLTDYKVIVLAVDEAVVSTGVQTRLKEGAELKLDDATKIIGCYKALSKSGLKEDLTFDPRPMRRALAFCQSIALSKAVRDEFATVADEYLDTQGVPDGQRLNCEIEHVDGTYNSAARDELLTWLKADGGEDTCRILTNAKCLSEGVDVPALDAIMFLHPRKSQIDVIQSVGRVMRRAEGKKLGYVILPVAIPPGAKPEEAMRDNERYRVVWQILNALRAHDERLDATINKASLGENISDKVEIIGVSPELEAVTATVEDIETKKARSKGLGLGQGSGTGDDDKVPGPDNDQSEIVFDEFTRAIMAKIVEKCGTRDYWDTWAKDIARIAEKHITRITTIVENDGAERAAFLAFLAELHDDLNPEISEADAIEMLAQHIITQPVFDTLFQGNQFTRENPVSKAMTQVLDALGEHNLAKESDSLRKFYASVQRRAAGIETAAGRQRLVLELYDKFFRSAFPRMTERLGIVYTPVEVVDFIIHSVNDVLKRDFGQTLGSEGVHIIDPFTGTGTFITRLLQSRLIEPDQLERKYRSEIHANEIVLLAYYIAAINIEAVYHEMAREDASYAPFEGICLTDTFQLYEQDHDMVADLMPDNSERRTRQKALDIRVIVGNPPYSAGQRSENDNAKNFEYPTLDGRIRDTYAAASNATLQKALYDSYIRAIRWASDRIGDAGVIGFVSNAGWVDGNATDGLRKCLVDEFSSLYVFHLRGNQRTSGELSRKEGGKIFGSGSRAPIAITILVKNPYAADHGVIRFHDIGDYLDQKQKLKIVREFGSVDGISRHDGWKKITPDSQNDWLDQADPSFDKFPIIGAKRSGENGLFENYSQGVLSARDSWAYNSSRTKLVKNMSRLIDFYNAEIERYEAAGRPKDTNKFVNDDARRISWTGNLKAALEKSRSIEINETAIQSAIYRPFQPQWQYFDRRLNERVYQMPRIFPFGLGNNKVIQVSGTGVRADFSVLMSRALPSYDLVEKGQCFPLYLYEEAEPDDSLFTSAGNVPALTRRYAITDAGIAYFKSAYPENTITKEDLFDYIYGLLHSPDYRERFKNNLTKALPRIPAAGTFAEFAAFRDAGRKLGDMHVNFESVDPFPVTIKEGDLRLASIDDPESFYRVTKMKFGGKGKTKDKGTVHYNSRITMTGIPLRAYDYIVNGKPALEWVMERQTVKTDKASGIVNDANDYANETVGDPAYPLELFQRIITVSLETLDIVESLPRLDFDTLK
ncbi:type ISP restriction/modification enzyme [Minwuia sp. IMCC3077]|uniref:DEAD/DEAH box helicase n=1 Tax=Minwuia sp. IMCC3077 TaxID=3040676 RepID=UPI002479D9C4|nr:type ISP restriction/modification enzyme [Minwuia sp. IMCC3077]